MRTGIYIGRQTTAAVLLGAAHARKPRRQLELLTPHELWINSEHMAKHLLSVARSLGRDARRADVACSIAIPEEFIREDRVSFTDVPKNPAELDRLVRFRLAREQRVDPDSFVCCSQIGGQTEDGETEFLARTVSKTLVSDIRAACRAAGLGLARLEGVSRFFPPRSTTSKRLSVQLVDAETEYVVLLTLAGDPAGHVHSLEHGSVPALVRSLDRVVQTHSLVAGVSQLSVEAYCGPELQGLLDENFAERGPVETRPMLRPLDFARMAAQA